MQIAILSHNAAAGDAIGNQVAEKVAFFLERGADVRVFVESDLRLHPALRPFARVWANPDPAGDGGRFLASSDLVVVEYGQHYPLLEWLPLRTGGRSRILFDYHGVTPLEYWGAQSREALEQGVRSRGFVQFADAALVHSRFMGRELVEPTGFPADRVHRLGLAVDTDRLGENASAGNLRDEFGLQSARVLLYVGRVAPNKRVSVLVEAVARLREVNPPVHALIVGDRRGPYEGEGNRCQGLAERLGVADRVHWLGHVEDARLREAYRCADALVLPSLHEGFGIPVVEAMACGLPVVAARAGALPETLGGAGLAFVPDDADDLARQIRRLLAPPIAPLPCRSLRVAVVVPRFGDDLVGGAEASLKTMALTLQEAGHTVEVFSTCTKSEDNWSNHYREGTEEVGGLTVHRFPIDPHDRDRHLASVAAILQAHEPPSEEMEAEYLRHSIHSGRLLAALGRRIDAFDAVIAGPYLFGLTYDVARAFPDQTVLVPCFHDEPLARLRAFLETYEQVGAVWYHSSEEQEFAQTDLGLNHPGGTCVGTRVDCRAAGNAEQGKRRVGTRRRYLVYAGRYSPQKGLPELVAYARRYAGKNPDRFTFVFLGQGDVRIPRESWACDLGFVAEPVKRDVLAGADALVQLSRKESLSLVVLEAWAQGVPVIVNRDCEVLTGQLRRCPGGTAVGDYEEFAAALDELWDQPGRWRARGGEGQEYVRTVYGDRGRFTDKLVESLRDLRAPLAERMRRRGKERARQFSRTVWREQFGRVIDDLLHAPLRSCQVEVAIQARVEGRTVPAGQDQVLVPVRVINRGEVPAVPEGPGRTVLRARLVPATGEPLVAETQLPAMVLPGTSLPTAMSVPVPETPATYEVSLQAGWASAGFPARGQVLFPEAFMQLTVQEKKWLHPHAPQEWPGLADSCSPLLQEVRKALVEANRLRQLPDDYVDETEGWFAPLKRRIKRKLLNNFRRAYVDVLARQQSAFNHRLLAGLNELAECLATLASLEARFKDSESRTARLEQRLARLEQQLGEREAAYKS